MSKQPEAKAAPVVMFKTARDTYTIEPVKVVIVKQTPCYTNYIATWLGEQKERRAYVNDTAFHDSWDAAKKHLIERAEARVRDARRHLELANANLGNINGMEPPKDPA